MLVPVVKGRGCRTGSKSSCVHLRPSLRTDWSWQRCRHAPHLPPPVEVCTGGTCTCPHLYLPTPLLWGSRGAGPLSCPLPVLLHEDQSSGGTSLQEVLLTLWFLRPREHFRNKQAPGQRGAAGSLVAP